MRKTKKLLCVILSVLLVMGVFNIFSYAKDITTGTMANIVVCVRFSDDTATDRFAQDTQTILKLYDDTTDLYQNMSYDFSFRAYIEEISRGHLVVDNMFPQYDGEKIVPFTLSKTLEESTDASVLQEVINAFNNGSIPFPTEKCDYRTTGLIDNLTVVLQGTAANASTDLMWPHKSVSPVADPVNGRYYVGNYNFLNTYSLLDSVTMQGTVSHEFLHSVGLPDLYRQSPLKGVPVGKWDIMASDSMYQQYPLSYQRYKMGWIPMQTISRSGDYTLNPVNDPDSDRILYKLETPLSSSEYFMLEYRFKDPAHAGFYDSKRFEARIPSSGLLIYRVNTALPQLTNFKGDDYLYVFRPGETSLTASDGDTYASAINPAEGETSYGSADMNAPFTDNTIFYSDGKNSGIVISNVSYNSDSSELSFHVEFPDYSSLNLWDNVGASFATEVSQTQGIVDADGNMYVLSLGMQDYSYGIAFFKYVNGVWTRAANTLTGVYDARVQSFGNDVYLLYNNSSGYPVVARLVNGKWQTIATDTSSQYPNSLSLFKSDDALYCGWVKDGNTLVIKRVGTAGVTNVCSSLTAGYLTNPALVASGNGIYALYSDYFASDNKTKLKKYNLNSGAWEEIAIPNPISQSNVHRATNNNGELWFLATATNTTPIVISVKNNGEVSQKTVPTTIKNFLNIGLDIGHTGTLFVGLFTSEGESEVLYLENGNWKKLGSSPCDSIQTADMFVNNDVVYVPSAIKSSGSLVVRSKAMPQLPSAELIAKDSTDIVIKDGYVIGIPVNAVSLSLYLEATEDGTFTYTSMSQGSEIYLYSSDNVLVKVYKIVVLGDINADSTVDGCDAVLIGAIKSGMAGFSDVQLLAADVDISSTVDMNDYNTVADFGLKIY